MNHYRLTQCIKRHKELEFKIKNESIYLELNRREWSVEEISKKVNEIRNLIGQYSKLSSLLKVGKFYE